MQVSENVASDAYLWCRFSESHNTFEQVEYMEDLDLVKSYLNLKKLLFYDDFWQINDVLRLTS